MDIKSHTHLPAKNGVYLMKDIKNQVIYVGKAKNLKSRVRSYFSSDKNFKNRFLTPRVHQIDYIVTDTESEAYLLEARLIKKHKPRYNVRLKDDKSYPYIRCSIQEDYPRFYVERRVKKKDSLYFGPWTTAFFARQMVRFLNEQFQIRDCSNAFMKSRKKPCLTYQMGHCSAPCVHKVSSQKYSAQVKRALAFLKGKNQKTVLSQLKRNIKKLALQERFESAIILRDRVQAIEFCTQKPPDLQSIPANTDVWAFYGEKDHCLFQILHIRDSTLIGQSSRYFSPEHPVFTKKTPKKTSPSSLKSHKEHTLSKDLVVSLMLQYYVDNVIPDLILNKTCFEKGSTLGAFSSYKKDFQHENPNKISVNSSLWICEKELSKIKGQQVVLRAPKSLAEKKLDHKALQEAKNHWKEQKTKQVLLQKGLREIQEKFGLKDLPFRMECFDVSHLQGQDQVASQVVFENGTPKKEDYRKYKIKHANPRDDFGSLKEALERRFRHKEYTIPDLLLIDGGKGQLKKAVEVLKEAGHAHTPVVSIAKKRTKSDFSSAKVKVSPERFYLPNRKNSLTLSPHSSALKILCHLRDEAHRFALAYHRSQRNKL